MSLHYHFSKPDLSLVKVKVEKPNSDPVIETDVTVQFLGNGNVRTINNNLLDKFPNALLKERHEQYEARYKIFEKYRDQGLTINEIQKKYLPEVKASSLRQPRYARRYEERLARRNKENNE